MKKETVLVTGASSGIGLELARQFATHGHPLVLTAPVESELEEIAVEFSTKHGVTVKTIAKDLKEPEACQEIFDELKKENLCVDILVNNAGFGHRSKFVDSPLEKDIEIIQVNIEAVIKLTRLFLPSMLERRQGKILNTASIAGFIPAPSMAVYHASKAFVLSFSEALATELVDSGVTLTALCPGATDTDFFQKAEADNSAAFQSGYVMSPREVAKEGYDALMRGDRVHVAGGINKLMVFSRRFAPNCLLNKMTQMIYEDVKPENKKRERGDIESAAAAKDN